MPLWTNDPSTPIQSLTPGVPVYSAGSHASGPTTRMVITNDVLTSNVVTLTVGMIEGNIPSVGDLIYVYKTSNGSGAYNQTTGIAITAVSINASTGVGTITYAQTHADIPTAADTGYAQTTIADVAEVSTPNQAYRAFAIPKLVPELGANRSITIFVKYPSAPAAIKWSLQAAMYNNDAEYISIIKDETAGGTFSDSGAPGSASQQLWPGSWNFVRYKDTGSSGGSSPTVIARITI